jgi:predicted O-methyltransferase YrrM
MDIKNERMVEFIKRSPMLYKMVASLYSAVLFILLPFDKIDYHIAIFTKRPYFGRLFMANQVWSPRRFYMQQLLESELESAPFFFRVLEVGSWAGSSAILWASCCKKRNKGKVFCIDTWAASQNAPKAAKQTVNNQIFKLFLHNIGTSGLKDYIVPIQCSSDVMAEILKPALFDFVYVDGDHAYIQCKRDLLNYMPMVKEGGIICGDDLELDAEEADLENAKVHSQEDFIIDPRTKIYFHPGVCLAVKEVFGKVSRKNGFWAMRKTKNGWSGIKLLDSKVA